MLQFDRQKIGPLYEIKVMMVFGPFSELNEFIERVWLQLDKNIQSARYARAQELQRWVIFDPDEKTKAVILLALPDSCWVVDW